MPCLPPRSISAAAWLRLACLVALSAALAGCGGGSGGSAAPEVLQSNTVRPQACSPNNPYRFDATAATSAGSLATEKAWLRDYFERQYLWFNEIPAVNPALPAFSRESDVYASLDAYFDALRTPARTASGAAKDRFSFTYPTRAWDGLINSGSVLGYGIEWAITAPQSPPRGIRVAFVHTGSTAEALGIQRGDTLLSADFVAADDTSRSGIDILNEALFPSRVASHNFLFARRGVVQSHLLQAGSFALDSVPAPKVLDVGTQKVGYLLFNDHVQTAEQPLLVAFQALRDAGVSDLVLDLRYNGGGYLYLASEVAYMIAGPARTAGKTFDRITLNSKRRAETSDTPFLATARDGAPLPTLNLGRVYVLTSPGTCSASEAIINGLRGIDVDVRLIGAKTCGKPYGFYGQDNCGVSYFAIEFQGENAKGFADYADGFIPGSPAQGANYVSGCVAADDFEHALGDPTEGQLAEALHLQAHDVCSPLAVGRVGPLAAKLPAPSHQIAQSPARSSRYLIGRP